MKGHQPRATENKPVSDALAGLTQRAAIPNTDCGSSQMRIRRQVHCTCGWCGALRIHDRYDDAHWVDPWVAEWFGFPLEQAISHGICPDCAQKMEAELEAFEATH